MHDLPQEKIAAMLAKLWQRNQPQILDRLALLDQVALAAASNTLVPEQKAEAMSVAHKLAGTLGTFGFPQATDLARALEQHLEQPHPGAPALIDLMTQLRTSLYPQR